MVMVMVMVMVMFMLLSDHMRKENWLCHQTSDRGRGSLKSDEPFLLSETFLYQRAYRYLIAPHEDEDMKIY